MAEVYVNVFAASLVVWTAFLLYAFHIWRRLRALQRKVEGLQRQGGAPAAPSTTKPAGK